MYQSFAGIIIIVSALPHKTQKRLQRHVQREREYNAAANGDKHKQKAPLIKREKYQLKLTS